MKSIKRENIYENEKNENKLLEFFRIKHKCWRNYAVAETINQLKYFLVSQKFLSEWNRSDFKPEEKWMKYSHLYF